MSFFSEGVTKDKLTVLYFMEALSIPLTRMQLTTVFSQYGLLPYFDMQSAVNELEEAAFLAAVPMSFGQAYAVTDRGREALSMFEQRLPQSERDDMDAYADNSRETLKLDSEFFSHIDSHASGGSTVTLKLLEPNRELFSISLLLPDNDSAVTAARLWREKAGMLYSQTLGELTDPEDHTK